MNNPKSSSIKLYSYTKEENLFLVEFGEKHEGWSANGAHQSNTIGASHGHGSQHISENGKRLRWKKTGQKYYYCNITNTEQPAAGFLNILEP